MSPARSAVQNKVLAVAYPHSTNVIGDTLEDVGPRRALRGGGHKIGQRDVKLALKVVF
jgi:hypothetical protein